MPSARSCRPMPASSSTSASAARPCCGRRRATAASTARTVRSSARRSRCSEAAQAAAPDCRRPAARIRPSRTIQSSEADAPCRRLLAGPGARDRPPSGELPRTAGSRQHDRMKENPQPGPKRKLARRETGAGNQTVALPHISGDQSNERAPRSAVMANSISRRPHASRLLSRSARRYPSVRLA